MHVSQKIWLQLQKLQYVLSPIEDVLLAVDVAIIHVDAEKFYPQFNKSFPSVVQKLSTETSVLSCSSLPLSFEIANHMLSHLIGAIIHEDGLPYDDSDSDIFSERDAV